MKNYRVNALPRIRSSRALLCAALFAGLLLSLGGCFEDDTEVSTGGPAATVPDVVDDAKICDWGDDCPCLLNSDCASGLCVSLPDGSKRCAKPCGEGCPSGFIQQEIDQATDADASAGDTEPVKICICVPNEVPGCLPSPETCDGEDNDCDGKTDEDLCDDDNPCTDDGCDPEQASDLSDGCTATFNDVNCDDGMVCTGDGQCVGGLCQGGPPKDCDDGSTCTADSCDPDSGECLHASLSGPCDDANNCTKGDACLDGVCLPGPATSCDDGNICTDDSCPPEVGACAFVANELDCDDGDACTQGDECKDGACDPGDEPDCDDNNPCTTDSCDPALVSDLSKGCTSVSAADLCDDGDPCTVGDGCDSGGCKPGQPANCDDGNGCTTDSCDSKSGDCKHALKSEKEVCDDGDPCTKNDACNHDHLCVGELTKCDDGKPCTIDACDKNTGQCTHVAGSGLSCDDGNGCTLGDACFEGICLSGKAKLCDDSLGCTDDSCDSKTGKCVFAPNTKACDDGNPCTLSDACADGKCASGKIKVCDDGNICTYAKCNTASGACEFFKHAKNVLCSDANLCTQGDACDDGVCKAGPTLYCGDDNECTDDSCAGQTGKCVHLPGKATCDDGNKCTTGDVCAGGKCASGPNSCECFKTADCDSKEDEDACNGTLFCDVTDNKCKIDSNSVVVCDKSKDTPCTKFHCDKNKGECVGVSLKNGTPCDADGSVCTNGDACTAGICKTGKSTACDDANPCTDDFCHPKDGCSKKNNLAPCFDGKLCTVADHCKDGACAAGNAKTCNDGDPCSNDGCNKATGNCQYLPASGAGCDDGNKCTHGDVCQKGNCIAQSSTKCNDGNSCTVDKCDPSTGKCGSKPAFAGMGCEDGKMCTDGDACLNGVCKSGSVVSCYDGSPCTADACDPATGNCKHTPANDGAGCNDGNSCTIDDICKGGKCTQSDTKICDDKSVCTQDACNKVTGQCEYKPVAGAIPCSDGSLCTSGDTCANGKCVPKSKTVCDDNSVCTDDECDDKTGKCVWTPVPNLPVIECTDNSMCTYAWLYYQKTKKFTDICVNGKCWGNVRSCNDSNQCTIDSCDPASGCKHKKKGNVPCNDGNACTVNDNCKVGYCTGAGKKCSDGNVCTYDNKCNSKTGCFFPFNTHVCNDNSVCTLIDKCKNGVCASGKVLDCNDGYDCTDDPCDPKKGCQNINDDTNKCVDLLPCTAKEYCKGGKCLSGGPTSCDDANECTVDSCHVKEGCKHKDIGEKPCNDGNACTKIDVCKDAKCNNSGLLDCDDSNECTLDTCNSKTGCVHQKKTGPCDDGDACTEGDDCKDGKCTPKGKVNCDDGSICTEDYCEKDPGCKHDPVQAKSTAKTAIFSDIQTITFTKTKPEGDEPADPSKAQPAYDEHPSWTAKIPGAVWIWRNAKVAKPQDGTSVGFVRNFTVPPSAKNITGTLKAAADEYYSCEVNGKELVKHEAGANGAGKVKSASVDGLVQTGNNEILCMVMNPGKPGTTWKTNPAGLLFTLELAFDLDSQVCDDGNKCTSLDICEKGECTGFNGTNCSDGNPCTKDTCDPKTGCAHTKMKDGDKCDDDNNCTEGDTCKVGKCVPTKPANCNDGNACTVDSCDTATGCQHEKKKVGQQVKTSIGSDEKTLVATDLKGNSNNPLLVNPKPATLAWDGFKDWVKIPGAKWIWFEKMVSKPEGLSDCFYERKFTVPSDVEAINGTFYVAADNTLKCQLNQKLLAYTEKSNTAYLKEIVVPLGSALKLGSNRLFCRVTNVPVKGDTPFTNPAGLAFRMDLTWYKKGEGLICDDGNKCTVDDACQEAGVCKSGPPTNCDDDNHCTVDSCDPVKGCANLVADYNPCNDSSVCSDGDFCKGGKCLGKFFLKCDDGNSCTADGCDEIEGCVHDDLKDGATCDDGDPCTIKNTCAKGVCKAGGAKACCDSNACTDISCVSGKGCKFVPDDSNKCDDGNFCTSGDLCKNGECLGKLTNPCDDGNACTKDACNAKQACVHTNSTGGVCEDGDACTLKDLCNSGKCIAGIGKECVDSQQCTVDGCDAKTGKCKFLPLSDGDCDDGNLCTLNDKCLLGKCKAGTPPPCGDGNPCTTDNCDPASGKCVHDKLGDGAACDDGSLCTKSSKCLGGKCVGASTNCDDKKPCTLDTCDPATGKCSHQNLLDGSPCNVGGKCKLGVCVK